MPKDLDLVAALADSSALEPFDGREVVRSTIEVTNAGDGLSQALAVDPQAFHHGQEVVIVLRTHVSKVGFKPLDAKDEDSALMRVHTLKAGSAVVLSEVVVAKVEDELNAQEDRIKRALEAAQGISRLPGIDPAPDDDFDDDDFELDDLS